MTDIAKALSELGVTEWVLRGEPTTQKEFEEQFRKVMGADSNGSAIEAQTHHTSVHRGIRSRLRRMPL